jgi:hypothetical protein
MFAFQSVAFVRQPAAMRTLLGLVLAFSVAGCNSASDPQAMGGDDLGTAGSPDLLPDPFSVPVMCTSGTMWTQGDRGSSRMHPGYTCVSCHAANNGPPLTIGGTVFPSAHEPDDCNASGVTGALVVITGADGQVTNLTVNAVGNFYTQANVAFPFTAKVTQNGKERAMMTPQMDGDCNNCHTQDGANMAPGRILQPQ